MGGVDNWLYPKQGNSQPRAEQYGFQTLATNLRGYRQNSQNGNSYGLINTEIRAPILSTFIKRPIQSSFLRNLQLVGFADLGATWSGLLPPEQNMSTVHTLTNPANNNVVVRLEKHGEVGFGYGAGLRTMVFGYFVRVDAGWNVYTTKPLWHISIGTDF